MFFAKCLRWWIILALDGIKLMMSRRVSFFEVSFFHQGELLFGMYSLHCVMIKGCSVEGVEDEKQFYWRHATANLSSGCMWIFPTNNNKQPCTCRLVKCIYSLHLVTILLSSKKFIYTRLEQLNRNKFMQFSVW